ncbi:hypothetical protein ACHAWO_009706 [Cyclotella atomus]|uniref:Uncharacterized protein n=1 Tax=Cyclotella atomus TaxID=382360 RepID=A0ABD3NS00_9STRA
MTEQRKKTEVTTIPAMPPGDIPCAFAAMNEAPFDESSEDSSISLEWTTSTSHDNHITFVVSRDSTTSCQLVIVYRTKLLSPIDVPEDYVVGHHKDIRYSSNGLHGCRT